MPPQTLAEYHIEPRVLNENCNFVLKEYNKE